MKNYTDKIQQLEEARDALELAHALIEEAIAGTRMRSNVKAYFLDHLKIMTSEGHGFLSSDLNIDKIIEQMEEEKEDDEMMED